MKGVFGYLGDIIVSYKLQNHFADFYKITCQDFYWDYIEFVDQFGKK